MPVVGSATVQYFEGSRYVGDLRHYCAGYRSPGGKLSSCLWPHKAYFCPKCGELWARAVYQYEFDYSPLLSEVEWTVTTRRCPRHGDGQFLSGLSEFEHCSDDLLRREVLVLLLKEQS